MNVNKPLPTLDDTRKLAENLAPHLRCGDVVTLRGDLGAGKTTFAQFLIRTLAGEGVEVTSPTFTLLQTYPVTLGDGAVDELYHYDLYRITHPSALVELGLDDAFAHLTLIEWPERLENYPVKVALALTFALHPDGTRSVDIATEDARWKKGIV